MWREVSNPFAAIGWIREELNSLLRQVRTGLEAAAERDDDLLADADLALDKLRLTLAMLHTHGATLLADEMHNLLSELNAGNIEQTETALSVLMQGLVTLDTYLDRLQAGGSDLPLLLLPILNDMRAAGNQPLLSEGVLFSPDLEAVAASKIPAAGEAVKHLSANTAKWQQTFTKAFHKFLTQPEDKKAASQMAEVCAEIYPALESVTQRRLWWIANTTISGLVSGDIDDNISLRKLFSRLEKLIPELGKNESRTSKQASNSLATALLYYIAIARSGNQSINQLSKLYQLDQLVMDPQELERARAGVSVQNRALFDSLSVAVSTELENIKERLSKLEDGDEINDDDDQAIDELITKLADTLKVLGLQQASETLYSASVPLAQARQSGTELDSEKLVLIAGEILSVENALGNHANRLGEATEAHSNKATPQLPEHELWQMISRLLGECLGVLGDIKEQLNDWMTGELSSDNYASIGQDFEHLIGALQMANHAPATTATRRLQQIAGALLEQKDLPTEHIQEIFADAFTALEMFLAASRDQQPEAESLLKLMLQRLDLLESGPDKAAAEVAPLPEKKPEIEQTTVSSVLDDDDILDIFLEEFDSVFENLEQHIPTWLANSGDTEARTEIRRGFHTLKGSGRMVGADEIAEFSWKVEMLLNQLEDGEREPDKPLLQTVAIAAAMLPAVKDRMSGNNKAIKPELLDGFTSILTQVGSSQAGAGERLESFIAELPESFGRWLGPDLQPAQEDLIDPKLAELIREEVTEHLQTLNAWLTGSKTPTPEKEAMRAAHTIAGSMSLAGAELEQKLAHATENLIEQSKSAGIALKETAVPIIQDVAELIRKRLETLEQVVSQDNVDQHPLLVKLGQFSTDIHTQLVAAADKAAADKAAADKAAADKAAADKAAADKAAADKAAADKAAADKAAADKAAADKAAADKAAADKAAADKAAADKAAADKAAADKAAADKAAADKAAADKAAADKAAADKAAADKAAADKAAADKAAADKAAADKAAADKAAADKAAEDQASTATVLDDEVVQIFMEEAHEVLGRTDTILNQWLSDLGSTESLNSLQREIHTLKGSSLMAGLTPIGSLSHAMETLLEKLSNKQIEPSKDIVTGLENGCDQLLDMVTSISRGKFPSENQVNSYIASIEQLQSSAIKAAKQQKAPVSAVASSKPAKPILKPMTIPALPEQPRVIHKMPENVDSGDLQEGTVRVQTGLLSNLVNYAGEISIYRSRLNQEIGGFRNNLTEVNQTISRLRDQLRKMEIETETQILSRFQRESDYSDSEFDPLELDRFSTIQQLSRALAESVADLTNLEEELDNTARISETLLLQQSRVNTELQESLMQTRLVHFATLAPRLRRLVRQASKDTNKKARLSLQLAGGSEGMLDRNVLEKITAPLEHILRNAIAHGIESPASRKQQKKPAEGKITITVENEATELLITIEDDGGGINLDQIRKRAIERGMLKKSDKISDAHLAQFIMESGFSTAEEITGIAGRGIGMDVVNSEIKAVGGSLDIHSDKGKGSRFSLRIPFTLAVMQAINVSAGDREFAIPLASVRGVAKLTAADYTERLASDSPTYEFAGEPFQLLELDPILGFARAPIGEDNISLLMIRTGEHRAAFRVTELHSHREIVIKPVGAQVASIPGILGGTITGDGAVQIVLDMGPMIRLGIEQAQGSDIDAIIPEAIPEMKRAPLILVVDDSITMRKITSRVLENAEMEVFTAKDGLDAVEQMYERIPDLIVLDIEMPRMDGYELATHVRNDARLRDLPMIMITSRSGQKHRDRAEEIGVNGYLSKPYQESDLVRNVKELLPEQQD